MKKNLLSFILLAVVTFNSAHAQNDKFTQAMSDMLQKSANAQSTVDFQEIANGFERIAVAEKTEWTPYYYAGLYNLMINFQETNPTVKGQYLTKGLTLVEEGLKLKPEESELIVLKVLALYGQMALDPMQAMDLFPITNQLLEKAKSINPDNPRIYLTQAEAVLQMPVEFGGGKEQAKPILAKAKENFDKFTPANPLYPNWGKERCEALLNQ